MQWTPTFYFNFIGKVQYFLIIAIHQIVPVTFVAHSIPANRKEI